MDWKLRNETERAKAGILLDLAEWVLEEHEEGRLPVLRVLAAGAAEALQEGQGVYLDIYEDYAEPGYTKDNPGEGSVIWAGDWNPTGYDRETREYADQSLPRLAEVLHRCGDDVVWSENYVRCDICAKAIRATHDCYSWQAYYVDYEGEYVCGDCIQEDPALQRDAIQWLQNDNDKALRQWFDLEPHGWTAVNGDFENGWHPGQVDNPKEIGEVLTGIGIDFVHRIEWVGQFDVGWNTFVAAGEVEKALEALEGAGLAR